MGLARPPNPPGTRRHEPTRCDEHGRRLNGMFESQADFADLHVLSTLTQVNDVK